MPLLLLAGGMFGVLNVADAARKRFVEPKLDAPIINSAAKALSDNRSTGNRLAAC
jgi:hypothetical protein